MSDYISKEYSIFNMCIMKRNANYMFVTLYNKTEFIKTTLCILYTPGLKCYVFELLIILFSIGKVH